MMIKDENFDSHQRQDTRIPDYISAIEGISEGSYDVAFLLMPTDNIGQFGVALFTLSHRVEQKFRQAEALGKITSQINDGLLLDDILEHVYEVFRDLIPYNRIGFALIEENGKSVRSRWAKSDSSKIYLSKGYNASLEGSTLQTIIDTGKPRIINDLHEYSRRKPESQSTKLVLPEGIQSPLTCPLITNGMPIGFIFFSSNLQDTYSEDHVDIFQRIADQLSVILEKGRLFAEILDQRTEIDHQNQELRRINKLNGFSTI